MSPTLSRLPLLTRLDASETAFLVAAGKGPRLSLYLPFDKGWREAREEKILLRDLRREAARALEARGTSEAGEAILAPVDALLAEPDTTRFHGEGLALFAEGERSLALLLPKPPLPSAQIDTRFRLDGILPQWSGRDRYYLLALSQHAIHLWDCDGVGMRALSLAGIDTDIRSMPHFEQAERQSSPHTNSAGHHGRGKGDSAHFVTGPGDGKEAKKDIEAFFRQIDHGIKARLPDPSRPMLLAGVSYLLPIYRRVNTYAHLLESDLPGNPGSPGTPEDLHFRANALIAERERFERNQGIGRFVENLANSRSCAGFTDTVPCAFQRRLTHLFLAQGRIQWGTFDPSTSETRLFASWRDGAEDLGNLACAYAMGGNARVFAFAPGEMPEETGIAGLIRT